MPVPWIPMGGRDGFFCTKKVRGKPPWMPILNMIRIRIWYRIAQLGGGNSNIFLFSSRNLGKISNLTNMLICFKWVGSTTNQVTSKIKMLETRKPAVCTGAHKNRWFFPFRLVAKISGSSRQFSGVWKINSIQSFNKSPGFGVAKLWSAVELNESCCFFVQPSSKHGLVEEKRM